MNEEDARTLLARRAKMDQAVFDEHEIGAPEQFAHYFACISISAHNWNMGAEEVGCVLLEFLATKLDLCVKHIEDLRKELDEKEIQE